MRIRKLWLDGYGRFSNRELELRPGLQVLLGPNEQGKSTTQSFVGDMLYGQKRSLQQRVYDDNHELRRPWSNPDVYGGRIMYELDDGRCFEVHRSFASNHEYARVYDARDGKEITGDFEQYRNREFNFAERHLGLSKEVFLSTATLNHLTLEGLGDADALTQIRERILSLADSGDEAGSAKAAIERLQQRIARIGRPDHPKRPLPIARNRLQDLQKEYEEAFDRAARVAQLEAQRREALRDAASLREQRAELERLVDASVQRDRAQRLREVESLSVQIDELTQRCFDLGSVGNFPLDALPEIQRLQMRLLTVEAELKRTDANLSELERQLQSEAPPAADTHGSGALPEELEDRLAELESRMKTLRGRRAEVEQDRTQAHQRMESLQKTLAELPDYSRVASDPVEWFTQLGASFNLAQRVLEEESGRLDVCEQQVARTSSELRPLEPLFDESAGFEEQVQRYEDRSRRLQELEQEAARRVEEQRFYEEEYAATAPTNRLMAFLALVFTVVLGVAAVYTDNSGPYIPAALCAVLLTYFLMNLAAARRSATRARVRAEEVAQQVESVQKEDGAGEEGGITFLMERGGCQTIRELEALYDSYCEWTEKTRAAAEALSRQQQCIESARGHLEELFAVLCGALERVGERPEDYADVPESIGRAIGKYQEYRDTKRRIADARDYLNHFDQHVKRLSQDMDETRQHEEGVTREIRRVMRAAGYDEAKHESTSAAVRAYKMYLSEASAQRGRIELLRQQRDQLLQAREYEESEFHALQGELNDLLGAAGVDSLDMWQELAALAREYHEARTQLAALEDRRTALLQGSTLDALRAAAGPEDAGADAAPDLPAVRDRIAELTALIEARQNEARDIEVEAVGHLAGVRPICQIEEERAVLMRQVQELELELQAASYAIALIQEAAKDKHRHIAPRLAELASSYLGEITGARYTKLLIDPGFEIHVQIPQREAPEGDVERRLSKGTVDQVYLALRLAMVRMLSRNGESIPMILDDPFANYDDERLARTMGLLARVAQNHQILLFTCRDDVASVGRSLNVPVATL